VLPRIVGLTHANDILISSRVFTAEEAQAMGFLNRIVPPIS
jgi:enoyl-CoA hydratase/carnithine racemase